ncbi:glucuronate isomerase [Jiangella asiatica]|uniref:Uronate isomerase n=1 Tax=Jiangella asiatica TaxID=2530372 RepID=A0A4R5C6T5_9ACTN|nr:glucuronate isomerase [Jiangella asiatica]
MLAPDRMLPTEPALRGIAREIHQQTARLPVVSMHGHVDARLLAENRPFTDPAELFVTSDHYVVRMLVSQGVPLEQIGMPAAHEAVAVETDPRAIWRTFCANWHLFRGTPSRYWLEHELVDVFGVPHRPSAETADAIYDHLVAMLERDEYLPRALLDRFDIEILATTDSATSTLGGHAALAREGYGERIVPTFRPDGLLHPTAASWPQSVRRLAERSGIDIAGYDDFLDALGERRRTFIAMGARATDHGHLHADTTPLDHTDAARIFATALRGEVSERDADAFSSHMLFEMARMSVDDGLVMQIHAGVLRDHNAEVRRRFGPDRGFDIPVGAEFTRNLRPLLEAFGREPGMRLVVFTVDETVYSRELAPLAGVYPAMRLGAPWWFLDSPHGMRRFRELVTETAGFYNTSGFVDDARAFASIPARHDLSRRIDAGYLARLVGEGQLTLDEAVETAIDLAYRLPLEAYARRSEHAVSSLGVGADAYR